jgi:type I restriction enzyme S subunit
MEVVEKKRLIPEIRFAEFENNWKQTQIFEHFEFKNGLNKEKEFFGKGTPIINFTDVYHLTRLKKDDIKGKVILTDSELERFSISKGDVLFTRTSETIHDIGMSASVIEEIQDCVFSGFVLRARPKNSNFSPDFTSYLFSTFSVRKEIIRKSSMTTRALTSGTLLNQVYFNFPTIPEQQKIAAFLSAVDEKIQQLRQKKALLEKYKKGVMQKLFPKKAGDAPELRFKKPNGSNYPDWQEKKLGEVCQKISSGKSKNSEKREVPLYGSTGLIGYCDEITHNGTFILIARVGANAGTINIVNGQFGVSDNTLVINSDELNLKYLYFKLLNFNLNRLIFGSGQPLITGGQLKGLSFSFPSKEEQQKIANFLSGIDQKINQVETQINQTQTFKKGLLQQMFV